MMLRKGREVGDLPLPTAVVRLEFGRRTGPGVPRADACALVRAGDGAGPGTGEPVHPGAPAHASGAVRHEGREVNEGTAVDTLTVDIASLASDVESVLVIARGDGGPSGRIPGMWLRIGAQGSDLAHFDLAEGAGGSPYVLGECYRDGGGWRFRTAAEQHVPPAALAPPAVRLSPVTLTGEAPAVYLPGHRGTAGELRIGLDWGAGPGVRGADGGIGLDLCALFELSDGSRGVVQPLGGAFGSLHHPPFILLGTGPAGTGDHLAVNLDHLAYFRRVLVFVTLYDGAPSFAGLRARVTLHPERYPTVSFDLDECTVPSTVCALALLTRQGPDLLVRREARYLVPRPGVSPQRTVDYAYGWGLNWTPGRS